MIGLGEFYEYDYWTHLYIVYFGTNGYVFWVCCCYIFGDNLLKGESGWSASFTLNGGETVQKIAFGTYADDPQPTGIDLYANIQIWNGLVVSNNVSFAQSFIFNKRCLQFSCLEKNLEKKRTHQTIWKTLVETLHTNYTFEKEHWCILATMVCCSIY